MVAPLNPDTADFDFELALAFVLALYFHIAAWHGHKANVPNGDREIGYATILLWVRATGFMLIAAFLWFYFAEVETAYDSAVTYSLIDLLRYIGIGLFFLDLVMGIAMVLYLALPVERLPKAFRYFSEQKPEGYREDPR